MTLAYRFTTKRFTLRGLAAVATAAMLGVAIAPAGAQAGPKENFPTRIELPDGFQPEGITTGRRGALFTGSLANGAIYRSDPRTGAGSTLVAGVQGRVAVGLDYDRRNDRIWVAGGPTGAVTVYDASTGAELARYTIAGSGFLNDLVVTRKAVFVTDSNVQRIVVIPLGKGGALPTAGAVFTKPLIGDISYVAGQFNANGIDAARGGKTLIIVQSFTRTLFRVDPETGVTKAIALTGGALAGGDGLELRGRTLFVVRGAPTAVVAIRLNGQLDSGQIVRTITDSGLDVPTTATFSRGGLYAVNARFGTPPGPNVGYWITRLGKK